MDTIKRRFAVEAGGPKYRALARAIEEAIASGDLCAGDRLPPVRELAWSLGVTPGTVSRAYAIQAESGLLSATVGRGTYVAGPARMGDAQTRGAAEEPGGPVSLTTPELADVGQVQHIRALMTKACASSEFLRYPTEETFRPAREAAKHWLRDAGLGPLDETDIALSTGGQAALLLIMQAVLNGPAPTVLVEELAFSGFRRGAQLLRANVEPVAMDEHGIIPQALDEAAQRTGAQLLCTTPEIHVPTCVHTPEERRREIAKIARQRDIHILEDNCYRSGASVVPTYRAIAPERAWYASSVSKALAPGVRIGFAVAPQGKGAKLRRAIARGTIAAPTHVADIAAALLSDPKTERFAQATAERFDARLQLAVNWLGRYEINWRAGMPNVWLTLPDGWRTAAFCAAADSVGVRLRSAEDFTLREDRVPHAVRVSMNAAVSEAAFVSALDRLAALLDAPPEQVRG